MLAFDDDTLLQQVLATTAGRLQVTLGGNEAEADALAVRSLCLAVHSADASGRLVVVPIRYNGATWDRIRNNQEVTLLASAARTASTNGTDQTNYNHRALVVVVDVTSITATPSITPTLQIKDSISGDYVTVWTAAAPLTATGEAAYLFVPGGAAGSYTEAVNLRLPRTWRLRVTHADADSITYSVSAVGLV